MHDYLSKAKSSDFHYFVLSIGTVRGKPMTASGRPRKSHISTLIQYLPSVTFLDSNRTVFSTKFSTVFLATRKSIIHKK